jgi:hypothetical protein
VAAADAASRADNAMTAWTTGARVMQPTYGSGTLVEVNEHHTGIACDEQVAVDPRSSTKIATSMGDRVVH